MIFFHGYEEKYIKNAQKYGMLGKDSGLKITQCCFTAQEKKFNVIAAEGGELNSMIKNNEYPFYIDRLLGGVFYHKYNFDQKLLNIYDEMLGENFLGIQFHECPSVLKYDLQRLEKCMKGYKRPWSSGDIEREVAKISSSKEYIHLSCGSAEEYSKIEVPQNYEQFCALLCRLLAKRRTETGGRLLPCDAVHMARYLESSEHTHMAEVGAQIPMMNAQLAMLRGMSGDKKWGTYYEPWGGTPLSAPMFDSSIKNEWETERESLGFDFYSHGENGGSSRELQKRIYYYSWLSGADFISEEWGRTNTFDSYGELTAYGAVKNEFIKFSRAFGKIKPYVPFCVVLPKNMGIVDMEKISNGSDMFKKEYETLNFFFAGKPDDGNEWHVLSDNPLASLTDIVYEGADTSKYKIVVNACNGVPRDIAEKTCTVLKSLPFEVCGMPFIYSQCKDKKLLAIFNNHGIIRSGESGTKKISGTKTSCKVRTYKGNMRDITVPEGEVVLVEI